uniref:Glycoside hydrolase family 3 protein n=1 Tax=termite gut metagenome TaxID=433724 RepID=S0DED1_9ZZZZ
MENKLRDTRLSTTERVNSVVSLMTLEEKVSQLVYKSAGVERLGIPAYHWWNECLHGLARAGTATVFPQAIGLAAMFDEDLLFQVATAISDEIRGKYNDYQSIGDNGLYKGITHYAPNINIFRDPRWGRGHETYGEDPYLTARLGMAFIRGIQGNDPHYRKADANVKHFVVHSGPERLRHEIDVHVGPKEFRETYLYAFAECIRNTDVACVMGAYNRVNGEPCSGSAVLLKELLRGELGFEGFTVSDSFAIDDFHLHHKVTADAVESAAMAFNNGCDQNGGTTFLHLGEAVRRGLVQEADIDASVARLLAERVRLGMFDPPEDVPFSRIRPDVVDCDAHRALAQTSAERSIVLLKNEKGLLPLGKNVKSLAVIGPNADSRDVLIGNYAGTMSRYTTLLRGIQDVAAEEGVRVRYAEGCHLYRDIRPLVEADLIPEAVLAAQKSDVAVLCLGLSPVLEGEESDDPSVHQEDDRVHLGLPGRQAELLRAVAAVGKPVVLVLCNGGPLSIPEEDPLAGAILETWYPGEEGGAAVADILFGRAAPSGRLPVTVVRSAADLPPLEEYSMRGRTYRYMEAEPLYPFGFGLSYARFGYGIQNLPQRLPTGEALRFTVDVENTGALADDAVLQVYLRHLEPSVGVPLRQLVWFRHLPLAPGEKQAVEVDIPARLLAIVREDGSCAVEPGPYELWVGGIQPDAVSRRLSGDPVVSGHFTLEGSTVDVPY